MKTFKSKRKKLSAIWRIENRLILVIVMELFGPTRGENYKKLSFHNHDIPKSKPSIWEASSLAPGKFNIKSFFWMKSNFREFAILCLVATDKTVASGIRRCSHANLAISTHSQGNTLVLVISIIADFLVSLLDQIFMHFRLFVCQRRHNFHGRVVPLECYQQP